MNAGSANTLVVTNGNVGIRTASPGAQLQVGPITGAYNQIGGANSDTILGYNSDQRLVLAPNAQSTFGASYVKSSGDPGIKLGQTSSGYSYIVGGANLLLNPVSGNVGIGTTAPAASLHVTNTTLTTQPLRVDAGTATSALVVNTNGNVGIGTASPLFKLQINGAIYANNPTTDAVYGGGLGDFANIIGTGGSWGLRTDTSNSVNLDVYNSGNPISALIVQQNGKVGIGTTNPSNPLTVYGVNSPAVKLQNSSTGLTDTDGLSLQISGNPAEAYLWNYQNTGLHIATSNLERVTILNSGNVGIGTTTPAEKLDVIGNIKSRGLLLTNLATCPLVISNGLSGFWNSNGVATYLRVSTVGSVTNSDVLIAVHAP